MELSNSVINNTETSPTQHNYQPIDPKDEIRILVLLPPASPDDAQLHCELTTAKITDSPSYEAISYCWGAEVFPERIHLPDSTLAITENLAAGLRRLRYPSQPRRLWVDAVCINQHDDKEKGHQVSLMAYIYRNAECVLVWLGEGSPETHAAVECIRELASSAWKYGLTSDKPFDRVRNIHRRLVVVKSGISAALLELVSKVDFTSLEIFFTQNWFKRLWVVQEFVLASKVDIYNGYDVLSPTDLLRAFAVLLILLNKYPMIVPQTRRRLILALDLILEREAYWSEERSSQLRRIATHAERPCKLDIDRVYALLALNAGDLGKVNLEIDYSLSTETVFTQLALAYLKEGDLDILHYVQNIARGPPISITRVEESSDYLSQQNLPSWVPDWRVRNTQWEFFQHFRAARKLPPKLHANESPNPNIIGLGGVRLDVIDVSISVSADGTYSELDRRYLAQILRFKDTFTERMMTRSYPTGEDLNLALARCLVLDSNPTSIRTLLGGSLSPGFMLKRFNEWLEFLLKHNVSCWSDVENISDEITFALMENPYTAAVSLVACEGALVITKSGYIGIGPFFAKAGDVVAVFDGARNPIVLREAEPNKSVQAEHFATGSGEPGRNGERWEIVGSSYIHGFMDNEVVSPEWEEKRQMFWIV